MKQIIIEKVFRDSLGIANKALITIGDETKLFDLKYSDNDLYTRSILFLKDIVVKFDRSDNTYFEQCKFENYMWTKVIRPKDKKYFSKVIAFDDSNKAIIHQRIHFDKRKIKKEHFYLIEDLCEKYSIVDYVSNFDDKSKNRMYNWGVSKDGVPVIYDYGR